MDIAFKILLFLHLVGMAYLLGGLLVQLTSKKKTLNRGILDGTLAQLITGPLLFWLTLTRGDSEQINHLAITAKIVLLIIMVIIVLLNRKSKVLSNKSYFSLLIFALAAVAFAVIAS